MSTSVLICDDSGFARKQLARAIPENWDVSVSYAENGQQAIEMILAGKGDVLFLDLNMPVMDGYQTMQQIRQQDLPTLVVVVSGDVQPQARQRMLELGALDFIRKPVDQQTLVTLLNRYGLYTEALPAPAPANKAADDDATLEDKLDAYRELVNVAMGRAGESLARLLDAFIDLPVPNVNLLESNELCMAVAEINHSERVSAVSKGFVSAGIKGEALVIFSDTNTANLVRLLNYQADGDNEQVHLEAIMDVSNILIGACLNALSEQLKVNFSHSQPILLGRHRGLDVLLSDNISRDNRIMAVEIDYAIKSHDIHFDLLLLFPNEAMEKIYARLTAEEVAA